MTREEIIHTIEYKLRRRRQLNEPEMQRARNAIAGPVNGIFLTFREAEGVLALLIEAQTTRRTGQ